MIGRYIARLAKSATMIPLMFTLILLGCDDKTTTNAVDTSTNDVTTTAKVVEAVTPKSYDQATLDALAKRYQDHAFSVQDASEVQLDGASAFVVTFSVPLNPKQNFSSKLHLVDSVSGTVDGAWELSDNLMELRFRHLQPKRHLTLTIDDGLEAINGAQLRFDGGTASYQIQTKDIMATVGFASRGSLLPTKIAEGLPIIAVNVESVDVDFFRIRQNALPEFLSSWQRRSTMNYWESSEFLASADLVYSGRFDLHGRPNTRETILLPLSSIKPLQDDGVYLAVMKQAGHYDNYMIPATMFTLSDIGLSVHQYNQRIDVFTQALQNGQALANINVTLLDNKGSVLAEVKTDKSGHAQFDKMDKATLILAENSGQTSIVALNQPALDLSEFAISGVNGYKTQFFAFGPRDIYRPGETLIVNGLLRDADGKTLPPQPVKVDIIKADQQVARSFVWQPNEGLYQYEYVIPDNAPTGNWLLRFNLGDDQPRYYQFKVEDFMPERMALEIKPADAPILTSQSATFSITGRYLYGAPASGNTLQGTLLLRPLREAVKALPGFEFGAVNEENLSRNINEFDVQLDENGQLVTSIENQSWSSVKSPISLIMQASLLESGGRPVTRRAEQAIWPADTLPGIRALFASKDVYDYQIDRYKKLPMVDEESVAEFEIIYADQQGHKLAATDLQVRLVNERRDYYWRWSDSGGWESGYDQKDLVIDTQSISTELDKATKVSFPVQWGAYRVEVIDPNNGLVSSIRFWAGYSWQENGNAGGAVRPDQVKMKIDKPAYTVGEKIAVHLDTPVAGKGYLLVESNDEPLWWQEITVPEGGADFTVTLDKNWNRHDLYLTAIVIRPGDKSQQAMPKRAIGILHIPLASEQHKLDIKLDAPAKIEPEQLLKVKIKAAVVNGNPLENIKVLVSAVDSGVLNITDFVTPDPYQAFFGRKRYGVDMYDVYGQLIEGKGRKGTLRFGGDGDDELGNTRGGMKPITFVNIIAQQAKPIQLNAQGEAEVELYIPDFNGELRLMAQAWSEDDFGSTEQKVIVAAPLIAELSTPRFMASGDESTLALDLHNLSGVAQNINVTITSQGLIGLTKPVAENVALAKDEKRILFIPVTALNGFGSGEITVNIDGLLTMSGTPRALQRKVNIGVRPPYPAKTENFSAIVHPGDSWQLPDISAIGMDLSTSEASLSISSRPPLNLKQYISELYAYPYGCLEQTTSGLFPSLYTNSKQLQDLGIKTGTDEARRDSITVGIERLLAKQIYNGGFGYWTNSDRESFWGTVYVTDFLLSAKAQGYSVAEKPLNQAIERLKRYMQNRNIIDSYGDTNGYRFSVQAYAGLVLARQQQISLSDLRQLYERRDAAISGLPLVQLGVALKLLGDETRAEQAVRAGLSASRNITRWQEDYGSAVRDKALILALLNEYKLASSSTRDQMLLSLSDDLRNKRYLSTQEKNAVFMVGRNYLNSKETQWSAKLTGKLTGEWSSTAPVNQMVDPQALTGGNELVSTTMGSIYPRLMVTGYPLMAPAPESNNLNIKREYFDVKGQPLDLSSIKTGQLIVVHLQVSAKSGTIRDALVVDLLPAGLELENQNLGDSSASLKYSTGSLAQLVNQMQRVNIAHQEYRDDRYVAAITVEQYNPASLLYLARAVTPGTYKVPAPMVESMYQPDVRAIGQSVPSLRIVKQ